MNITSFAFVIYPVSDLTRARAFYEGVLGLTAAMSFQEGEQFYVEYEVGPHALGLSNEPFLKPSGDGPHLVVEVDDFDNTVLHLKQHRVPIAVEPFELPGCRAVIVTDPDGNKLGLHQRKR